jgi:cadmium resistance protein CadD (predicted permease)
MVESSALELGGLAGLVVTGYLATHLDNLIILVVLLGAAPGKRAAIILGFITAAISVIALCGLGVLLGGWLHPALVGYLGLAPLCLGLHQLYTRYRRRVAALVPDEDPTGGGEAANWLSSFLLMAGNSGDSIAVFLPLLAESSRDALLLISSGFLLMALAWSVLALLIAGEPRIARRIEARGAALVPWIMIGVGLYILLDTGTDTLL